MAKFVKYNGGKNSFNTCSNPQILVKDKLYEVIEEEDFGFQTNYTLKGIPGKFNSVWFDELISYFAYSDTIPVKGTHMESFIRFEGLKPTSVRNSSTVIHVEAIGENIYKVFTRNTLYIVKILN